MAPGEIHEFRGRHRFLSNFYTSSFVVDGRSFPTVEHAFQYLKCDDANWRERILMASTPGEAKRLGRRCPMRSDWGDLKVGVMRRLVSAKFSQNAELGRLLLQTGNVHLEERNSWGDRFWGTVGGVGDNVLGRILMDVRRGLREQSTG